MLDGRVEAALFFLREQMGIGAPYLLRRFPSLTPDLLFGVNLRRSAAF
jgi:hypothetical protein